MKKKILNTVLSIIVSAIFMYPICKFDFLIETLSGGNTKPHYTEYYYKAKDNLNKKQFVDVTISRPAFLGLLNKHDYYSYFCNSKKAVNTLKQQIISQKQLPTTNSNYILYNDEGKATNTSVAYPTTDTFTVHEPKTGQDIIYEAQHSTSSLLCKNLNSLMKQLPIALGGVILTVETIVVLNIWRPQMFNRTFTSKYATTSDK